MESRHRIDGRNSYFARDRLVFFAVERAAGIRRAACVVAAYIGPDHNESGGTAAEAFEYGTVRTVGDTMYVQVNPAPVDRGIRSRNADLAVTAVIPQDKQVELRGYNNVTIPINY
jgi:hypothetical protein